ncbi:non-hydrolyzing UDP-N-acetylglucosamine 2-epimerase [Arundinibacter roseus]|uniref:UDP-N-acetylglucosamine 2-epimerase (Non-hydrolyzing) n=1 Tax=Arundinibacter roseus TaxID=2070510 RepID=A0A4R4K2E3_9BACT|nr:UDP-N-acetylglucosamine 2-epimerase (non-hydrolyzing) [Arundinibacter roseus]TDB61373.1 UDP-N-acetylglucosamine 2-epimerase (non-hydrolyzing) [Arundinibacter roseus]
MKILSIVGARPNFMKVAPLHRAFLAHPTIQSRIVHTGQHYDSRMSDVFFNQLQLPVPDYFLGIGGGSHTQQMANIMLAFEPILQAEKPDVVLVVGDVNSTIACALVAVKEHIPVVHVEAGLRSGDRGMPEEINRILTDSISDFLFVTERAGMENLAVENVASEKVFFVGNVMIDSLVQYRQQAQKLRLLEEHNLPDGGYVLMTMHRPANVDQEKGLKSILQIIKNTAAHQTVVFPVHPRTLNNLERFGLRTELEAIPNLYLMEPQGYLEFLNLMEHASLIITDSGGIQEETTFLQIPCLTFRDSTERPITVELGTNYLLSDLNPESVHALLMDILNGQAKKGTIPPLWDGHAAERITNILLEKFCN